MGKSELVTRSLTGVLIVAITLAAVIFSPYTYVLWLIIITFYGSREYLQLDIVHGHKRFIFLVPIMLSLLVGLTGILMISNHDPLFILVTFPLMMTSLMIFHVFAIREPTELSGTGKSIYTAGIYVGLPMITACLFLQPEYFFPFVLIPIILIWINDVFAYLIGSKWGTNKIMPLISPGKSFQGTIGGGFVTVLVSLGLMKIWPMIPFGYVITLGIGTPLFALGGDLWESALKRNAGVKDSGNILPGHGGMLDRYDSLLFVMPLAAIAYFIFVL